MPRLLTDQELASTDAMWDSYNSKVDNLSKRKEEKLSRLAPYDPKAYMTDGSLGEGETEGLWNKNKVHNEYNPAELQYLEGRAYQELGVVPTKEGYFTRDTSGELVPYAGTEEDLASYYGFGTKGNEDVKKAGKWAGSVTPEDRYLGATPNVDKYGEPIGPAGVNVLDREMNLLYPRGVDTLMEGLGHGNKYVLENRADQEAGFRSRFGTGSTEAYTGGWAGAFGGDSREYVIEDKEKLWAEFSSKYGLDAVKQKANTPKVFSDYALGSVSGKYESSGDASAINADDQGAPSYGKYQLSVAAGTMQDFLARPEGQKLRNVMGNLDPASEEFQARFKKAMQSKYGKDLLADQQKYIQNTHYEPVAEYAKGLGIDTSIPAIQEMLWSQSVQHSGKGNKAILDTAVANLPENASYEDLIKNVYTARNEYARKYIANPTDIAADRYINEQNDVLAMLSQQPTTQESTDESDFDRRLRELIEKDSRSNLAGVDKAVDEAAQTLSSIAANVAKGVVEIADVGQELATYPIQAAVRAYTGDSNYDIDLLDKESKEGLQKFIDSSVGYDRGYDEKDVQFILSTIKELGIDITSTDSIKEAYSRKDFWDKMGDVGITIATNPSLTMGAFAEILGSGLGLGAAARTTAFVGSKIAPQLSNVVGKALQLNKTKTDEAIRAVKAKNLSKAEEALEIGKIDKAYTFSQKVVDGIKGSSMVNADFAVRMNTDIEEYVANNEGNYPDSQKMLEMAVLNKLMASAEVGALKSIAKANVKAGKEAIKGKLAKASALALTSIVKGTLVEGTQETLDGIVQNINQKLDSKKYENYTVEQIISESSADILTGTVIGAGAGTHLGVATEVLGPTGKALVGYSGDKLRGGLDQVKEWADGVRVTEEESTTPEEKATVTTEALNKISSQSKENADIVMGDIRKSAALIIDSLEVTKETKPIIDEAQSSDVGKAKLYGNALLQQAIEVNQQLVDRVNALKESDNGNEQNSLNETREELIKGIEENKETFAYFVNTMQGNLAVLRQGGRVEEAAVISAQFLSQFPDIKQFGASASDLKTMLKSVIANAELGTDVDADVLVEALKAKTDIETANIIDGVAKEAKVLSKAYKELSTASVANDAADGPRGFNVYYNNAQLAKNKDNKEVFDDNLSKLELFKDKHSIKLANIQSSIAQVQEEIQNYIGNLRASGQDISFDQGLKIYNSKVGPSSDNEVSISDGENSFKVMKGLIALNMLSDQGKGSLSPLQLSAVTKSMEPVRAIEKEVQSMEILYTDLVGGDLERASRGFEGNSTFNQPLDDNEQSLEEQLAIVQSVEENSQSVAEYDLVEDSDPALTDPFNDSQPYSDSVSTYNGQISPENNNVEETFDSDPAGFDPFSVEEGTSNEESDTNYSLDDQMSIMESMESVEGAEPILENEPENMVQVVPDYIEDQMRIMEQAGNLEPDYDSMQSAMNDIDFDFDVDPNEQMSILNEMDRNSSDSQEYFYDSTEKDDSAFLGKFSNASKKDENTSNESVKSKSKIISEENNKLLNDLAVTSYDLEKAKERLAVFTEIEEGYGTISSIFDSIDSIVTDVDTKNFMSTSELRDNVRSLEESIKEFEDTEADLKTVSMSLSAQETRVANLSKYKNDRKRSELTDEANERIKELKAEKQRLESDKEELDSLRKELLESSKELFDKTEKSNKVAGIINDIRSEVESLINNPEYVTEC